LTLLYVLLALSMIVSLFGMVNTLVIAALAGIGAAVLPARRAARLNVLEALHYE
jgi:ABC-type antimicrobial peptide transport system permease subunit